MARIRRLLRPDVQALNWKAAIPVLGLAVVCAASAHAPAVRHEAAAQAVSTETPIVDLRTCRKPHYPKADLDAGHEGTVTLGFLVDETGAVADSKVTRSSGYASMDESARAAIAKCSFLPARQDGRPVATWAMVQYVWTVQ